MIADHDHLTLGIVERLSEEAATLRCILDVVSDAEDDAECQADAKLFTRVRLALDRSVRDLSTLVEKVAKEIES